MSDWVLNRLISFVLDTAAVCEAGAAVIADRSAAEDLSRLCTEGIAAARELTELQRRLGGRVRVSGSPQGTARCDAVMQLAHVSDDPGPAALATALRSVDEGIRGCERLSLLRLAPLVRSAVCVVDVDLRSARARIDAMGRRLRRHGPRQPAFAAAKLPRAGFRRAEFRRIGRLPPGG